MTVRPVIAPIVEGHGEVKSLAPLIMRLAQELGVYDVRVENPFRLDAKKMLDVDELERAVRLQARRVGGHPGGVLILRDGDDKGVACVMDLVAAMRPVQDRVNVSVQIVIACQEFEAWILASIDAMRSSNLVRDDAERPGDPESIRGAKEHLRTLLVRGVYSETVDQPKLAAQIDPQEAGRHSRSFRRMRHAVEQLLTGV